MEARSDRSIVATRIAEAERAYKRGWVLTPLDGKKPILKNWTNLPAPKLQQILEWARLGNVGLRTGTVSGVFVVDVDPSSGGDGAALGLPATPTVLTGGGGFHHYFKAPGNVGNSVARIAPGVDTRGDGGHVVFVGSMHPESGRVYTWAPGLSPDDVPLAALPARIETFLRPAANQQSPRGSAPSPLRGIGYAQAALRGEEAHVRSAPKGERNNTLNSAAFNLGQLVASGLLSREEVVECLLQAACDAGLGEREAISTIRSGLAAGSQRLRAVIAGGSSSEKPSKVVRMDRERSSTSQRSRGSGRGRTQTLPVINAGDGNLPRMASEVWKAVQRANDPPRCFRYGGLPSRLQEDDRGVLIVRELTQDRMRYLLARVATWVPYSNGQPNEVAPPMSVVRDMLACPDAPLPILTRIIEAPIFAPDGSLCVEPGYHQANTTYYAPAKNFTVPRISPVPTSAEMDRARSLLLDDLLVDFPFTEDPERANALALALLPFVRELIDGATPLHLFEKPSPGTGATLLVLVLLYPALGHPVATMTEGRDEEEWRKRVTAKLMQGPTAILIDNLRNPLESPALASAITSPVWEDRILGVSQMARIPVLCAWVATGNNPILSNPSSTP